MLGCCQSIEKMQNVRLNGIQLAITQLLPKKFQYSLKHRVRKSFYFIRAKPISHLSDQTRRKELLKKGGLLGKNASLTFVIIRTKRMQNQNGLKICRIALQRKALPKVYKNLGPNPSGISDLRQYLNFEVQQSVPKNATT